MVLRVLSVSLGVVCLAALTAAAHQGVTNPAVMTRMESMTTVANQMKILGTMAKGQIAFDADAARKAGRILEREASGLPALFEAQEMDPKSEAAPAIWENWSDFVEKSEGFKKAAAKASVISTAQDLGAAMGALGASCKSCHQDYRIER